MNRRELLQRTGMLSFIGALPLSLIASEQRGAETGPSTFEVKPRKPAAVPSRLKPPAQGSIPVAFLISEGAVVIDFCGPWEVFQDAVVPGRQDAPFRLYTVAETTRPIRASAGLTIVPDYTLAS